MTQLIQQPLFWAVLAIGGLIALLAVAALRLAQWSERVKAAAKAERDLAALRADLEAAGRARGEAENARAAAEARAATLGEAVAQLSADTEALRSERDGLGRSLAALQAEARGFERQIVDLKQAKEEMRLAFSENAGALMKSHSETFKEQNKEQIDALLAPLKNDIDAFKRSFVDAHAKSLEQHGSLKEQLDLLARQSAAVSKEAENLARALKGDVQLQGAWGEMIVDTILSRLGLREGVEYTRQETFSDAEGRARTDYILRLPQGDAVIIDSKVSLVDFERFISAGDDAARSQHLAAHARSLRSHVRGLSSKEYQARVGTRLDFVILFVPIEAALGAALTADEMLTLDALDQKVAIATPTTLTTTIQTIAAMWKVERQNQNAEAIAERAGRLYDKFVGFMNDISAIGDRLTQAGSAYEKAMTKLSGAGGLVRQAEILKAMGAKTAKSLPRDLLDAAGASDQSELLQIESLPADDDGQAASVQ